MRLDDGFDDGQSQPGAFALSVGGVPHPVEAVEDARELLGWNLLAGILHADDDVPILLREPHGDGFATGRVPDRIGDQIAERPAKHFPITADRCRAAAKFELHASLFHQGLEVLEQPPDGVLKDHALQIQIARIVLGLSQEQHVVDHAVQAPELFQVGIENLPILVGRAGLTERHFRLRGQVRDRRAQLVGDVGREVRQLLEPILDAPEHVVEGRDGFFQLDRYSLGIQSQIQLGRGDRANLLVRPVDRNVPPANREPGDKDRDAHDHADGPPLDALEAPDEFEMAADVHRHGDRVGTAQTGVAPDLDDATSIGLPVLFPYRHALPVRQRDGRCAPGEARQVRTVLRRVQRLSAGISDIVVDPVMPPNRTAQGLRIASVLHLAQCPDDRTGDHAQLFLIHFGEMPVEGSHADPAEQQEHHHHRDADEAGDPCGERSRTPQKGKPVRHPAGPTCSPCHVRAG